MRPIVPSTTLSKGVGIPCAASFRRLPLCSRNQRRLDCGPCSSPAPAPATRPQGSRGARRTMATAGSGSASGSAGAGVRVALLGIGLMGNKMARRLRDVGFEVVAWNRTLSAAQQLANCGCSVAATAREAIDNADVVLLMLADARAIEATILDDASACSSLRGKTVLQMGTIGPQSSRDIAARVREAGADYLEAPVLGSQPEASKGTLLVMVGCDSDPASSRAWPVLQAFGHNIQHMGGVGTGAATKLAMNQLIASLTVGFSTSLGLLLKNGVDCNTDSKFMAILRDSALYAPTFDKKLQRMLDRDYANPNFPTKHLLKDVRLFADVARESELDTSLLEALSRVIQSTTDRGLDNTDYSAVFEGVYEPRVGAEARQGSCKSA